MPIIFVLLAIVIAGVDALSLSEQGSIIPRRPFCVNLSCEIQPSRRQDFLELIRDNQKQTLLTEPEALQYTVGEDVDRPNVFYIHEQFATPQGFDFHRATAHNANWQKFKESDPFVVAPTTYFFNGNHEVTTKKKADIEPPGIYCLNVELNIESAFREEFLETIRQNAEGSNTREPLCRQYVWGEDTLTDQRFLFHEQYDSIEGFRQHQAAPHFIVWEKFAAQNPFTKAPVIQVFETI